MVRGAGAPVGGEEEADADLHIEGQEEVEQQHHPHHTELLREGGGVLGAPGAISENHEVMPAMMMPVMIHEVWFIKVYVTCA